MKNNERRTRKYPENNLRKMREAKGYSRERLAKLINTNKEQIYKLEAGERQLTPAWMTRIAPKLGVTPMALMFDTTPMVPVLGYVGAGAEVFPIDDHALGSSLEEVECPIGYTPENIVALRVRGDSMEPQMEDGWLIFYRRLDNGGGVPPECIGELCVIQLENDGLLVKKIRNGSKPGHYHLVSKNPNREPIIDAQVLWASRVIDIRPSFSNRQTLIK